MTYKTKIGLILAFFIVLTGLGIYRFWFGGERVVPIAFSQSRIEAAKVADNIARLSSLSLGNLEVIAKHDREKNYEEALKILQEELARNREARVEAMKLSNHLDQMAKSLPEIKPRRAQSLATEAVGQEINLINHLITRNELLQQLFELLEAKFKNSPSTDSGQADEGQIKDLINKINDEAIAINRLNYQFNSTMERFDAFTLGRN